MYVCIYIYIYIYIYIHVIYTQLIICTLPARKAELRDRTADVVEREEPARGHTYIYIYIYIHIYVCMLLMLVFAQSMLPMYVASVFCKDQYFANSANLPTNIIPTNIA